MDFEILTWVLLICGALLMLFEVILPGGISFCVGLSTAGVGLLYHIQWLLEPADLFVAWGLLSILTGSLGVFLSRCFFGGSRSGGEYDEDRDVEGRIVDVLSDITPMCGRVSYQGSSWEARTKSGTITAGKRVKVTGRKNISWMVQALDSSVQSDISEEE